jgi:Bacterial SH3 domain
MKWFLQFLSIGSAVLYMLLVTVDHRIRDGTVENTVASEAQSDQPRLNVWGPYLPNRSVGQDRRASLTIQPTHQQNEALAPEPYRQSPRQYFDDQPALKDKLAASAIDDDQIGKAPTSLPITGASFEPSVPLEGKEATWFVVSRAARLHAGPSVSSPITHFYPVGTELKLIGYAQGWFQVSDPATSRQGWIYEKYYLQAISGPGQTRVAVQDLPSPTRVAFAASKPKPVSRVKKPRSQQKVTKPRRQQRVRIARIQMVERPFRGYY